MLPHTHNRLATCALKNSTQTRTQSVEATSTFTWAALVDLVLHLQGGALCLQWVMRASNTSTVVCRHQHSAAVLCQNCSVACAANKGKWGDLWLASQSCKSQLLFLKLEFWSVGGVQDASVAMALQGNLYWWVTTQPGTKVKGQVQGRTSEGTVECSEFTFFCLVSAALNSSFSAQTQWSLFFSSQSINYCGDNLYFGVSILVL